MAAIERAVHEGAPEGTVIDRILGWPMGFPSNPTTFEEFGTTGGSLPGLVTEASYLATSGEDRSAVVLFFKGLTEAESRTLLTEYAHQSFMTRLVTDRSFLEDVCAVLGPLA